MSPQNIGQAVCEKERQVHVEVSVLDKAVSDCQATVDELEKRLNCVLQPSPPQPPCSETPKGADDRLHGRIALKAERVRLITQQVNDIISRLEV